MWKKRRAWGRGNERGHDRPSIGARKELTVISESANSNFLQLSLLRLFLLDEHLPVHLQSHQLLLSEELFGVGLVHTVLLFVDRRSEANVR